VELVVVIPAVMIVMFLAVQAALWAEAADVVQAAAATGSQTAAGLASTPSAGAAAARSYLATQGSHLVTSPTVEVESLQGGSVEVRVDASAVSIVGLFHLGVSAIRVEPKQEFRESG
jgi:hypothetical protein